jgi:hypothetical protein
MARFLDNGLWSGAGGEKSMDLVARGSFSFMTSCPRQGIAVPATAIGGEKT